MRKRAVRHHSDVRVGAVLTQLALLLPNLNARTINQMVDKVMPLTFEAGEMIVEFRKPSEGIFFLVEGNCTVCVPDITDREERRVVRALRPGDSFGELSLMHNQPTTASVLAATACKCQVPCKSAASASALRLAP